MSEACWRFADDPKAPGGTCLRCGESIFWHPVESRKFTEADLVKAYEQTSPFVSQYRDIVILPVIPPTAAMEMMKWCEEQIAKAFALSPEMLGNEKKK